MTRETFYFKNHAQYEAGRLVPNLFLFFKKVLYPSKKETVFKTSKAKILLLLVILTEIYLSNFLTKIFLKYIWKISF